MKKITALLIAVIILVLSLPIGATAAKNYVFDYTGTMSSEEISDLTIRCRKLFNEYDFDVMFVIAAGTNGKSLEKFATDLYDDYCEGSSGAIFVYNTAPANDYEDNWAMISFDKAQKLFKKESTRNELIDQMKYDLKRGTYYDAAIKYINKCRSFAEGGMKGDPIDTGVLFKNIGIALLIALVISWIIVGGMKKKLKTAVKQRGAMQYIDSSSASITVARDLFMYSTTTKIRKESNSSGGGHSYSGRSGGGHSYSGGGGRI